MSVRNFSSPATFAAFLGGLPVHIAHEKTRGLEEAARLVQTEAKAAIGHYQGAASPFAAWAPLADATMEDRVRQGFTPDDPLLRTGGLRDSIQRSVGHDEAVVGSNEPVAVYQELGTRTIPPRSFLGGAAVRKSDEIAAAIGRHYMAALVGERARINIAGED